MHNDDMECFYQVAVCQGLRKASDRLNLAPSVVSRQLGRLESELQIKLFDRNSRSMTLTPAGEIFLRYVEDMRQGRQHVLEELAALKGLRHGHVRLCTIEGYAAEAVAASIASFREHHPGITFDMEIDGSDEIMAAIASGRADIGLSLSPSAANGVECAFRAPAPLCAVVWPGHPLADRSSVSLAELAGHPIALQPSDTGIRHLIDSVCRIEKLHLEPVMVTGSISAMKTFVQCRGGIAILLGISLPIGPGAPVVGIPLADPPLGRTTLDACVLGRRRLSPAVKAYLHHLRERIEQRSATPA